MVIFEHSLFAYIPPFTAFMMLFRIVCCCLGLLASLARQPLAAQQWANEGRLGDADDQQALGITVDPQGNFWVTGYFYGCIQGSNCRTDPDYDMFVARYLNNGALDWVRTAGSANNFESGNALAANDSGMIYVVGSFSGSALFNTVTLNSTGGTDAFIAKYGLNGNLLWVRGIGGGSSDAALGVTIGGDRRIYVTGTRNGAGFLAVYSASGAQLSLSNYTGTYALYSCAWSATRLALGGETSSSPSSSQAAILQVNPTNPASIDWTRTGGLSGFTTFAERVTGLIFDGANRLVVYAQVAGSGSFQTGVGPGPLTNLNYTGAGGSDAVLVMYTGTGEIVRLLVLNGTGNDRSSQIARNPLGDQLYVGGTNGGTLTLGSFTVNAPTGALPFIAKFDTAFAPLFAGTATGSTGTAQVFGYALGPTGTSHICGVLNQTVTFRDPITSAGQGDAYWARYTEIPPTLNLAAIPPGTQICPGDSLNLNFTATGFYGTSNLFLLELSDPTGSFANPGVLAQLNRQTSGTFRYALPVGTPAGSTYRIRARATNPAITSPDLAFATVLGSPNFNLTSSTNLSICPNQPVFIRFNLAGNAPFTLLWDSAGTQRTRTFAAAGAQEIRLNNLPGSSILTFRLLQLTSAQGCVLPIAEIITVGTGALAQITPPANTTVCQGTTLTFTSNAPGNWDQLVGGVLQPLATNTQTVNVPFPNLGANPIVFSIGTCRDTVTLNVVNPFSISQQSSNACLGGNQRFVSTQPVVWTASVNGVPVAGPTPPQTVFNIIPATSGTLSVTAELSGCSSTLTAPIILRPTITATDLGGAPLPRVYRACENTRLLLSGDAPGTWIRNNPLLPGFSFATQNFLMELDAPGRDTVIFILNGCSDTVFFEVDGGLNLQGSATAVCQGASLIFRTDGPASWAALLNGVPLPITPATIDSLVLAPAQSGQLVVVAQRNTCSDTLRATIQPNLILTQSATNICEGDSVTFTTTQPILWRAVFRGSPLSTGSTPTTSLTVKPPREGRLTVSALGNGCTNTLTTEVFFAVRANITKATAQLLDASFVAQQAAANAQYLWEFGDGNSGTGENVNHSYLTPGSYPVRLIVVNGPCTDTAETSLTVTGPPPTGTEPGVLSSAVVYPNPAKEGVFLRTARLLPTVEYSWADLAGRTLDSGTLSPTHTEAFLPLPNQAPAGLLLLYVRSESQVQMYKIWANP